MILLKWIGDIRKFILDNDFVDIYIYPNEIIKKDFWDTKPVAKIEPAIKVADLYKMCNELNKEAWVNLKIPKYTEYFAVYIKWENWRLNWFRWTYWEAIQWEYMNFRSLSSPKPLNTFVKDPYLTKFFAESFTSEDWVIVSWPTGSWKTTLLVSFFDFINQYTPEKYEKEKKKEFIKVIKWINLWDDKIEMYFNSLDIDEQEGFYALLKNDSYYKMLETIQKENKKIVYTIENPIEYFHKSNNIQFFQHDVLTHWNDGWIKRWIESVYKEVKSLYKFLFNTMDQLVTKKIEMVKGSNVQQFQRLADRALRTNPEYLLIWEIKNPLEFDIFLRAISFWIPVYTTSHADDAFAMIQRIYDTSTFSSLEKLWLIARKLYWIVNTRIYFLPSLWSAIPYFDILYLNDYDIRSKLYNFLKVGDLHKFAEEMENLGMRSDGANQYKIYYLNKKSSALYAIMNIMNEKRFELENPNIKGEFDKDVKYLLNSFRLTEKDYIKFMKYYHIYIGDDNVFNTFKEYLSELWVL